MEVDWPWETPCFNLLTLLTYLVNMYTKTNCIMCKRKNGVQRKMEIKSFWCMRTKKKTSVREGY